MSVQRILLGIAFAAVGGAATAADDADDAWIARYVASAQAPGVPPARGRAVVISQDQLPRLLGRRVLAALRDGSELHGRVQQVDETSVVLRSGFGANQVLHTLVRSDIVTLQAD